MVNWKSRKLSDILVFANGMVLLVLINLVATRYFVRVDLTEEKRYSIKTQTRDMLKSLDDVVYIEVYLEGDLNAGFRRFQKNIRETLEEFRIYSNNKVRYTFTDPTLAMGQKARSEFMADLANRGIQPTNVVDNKDGQRVEKIIFPGALVSYGGMETGVMLLKGNKARSSEEEINQSIEGVEYEIASAIHTLANTRRKRIGLVTGHGELDSLDLAGFRHDLQSLYDVSRVSLNANLSPKAYDALVIAKPVKAYPPLHKLRLDQYIMHGGKVLFLLDKLGASMDSASNENYLAFPYNLDLDDQLFRYGVRINMDLVQDKSSAVYPVVTGQTEGGKPRLQLMEWPFFPLINHYADHAITRNLDAVVTRFVSSIDTVKAPGIKKTPLLFTSAYSRTVAAPVHININTLREQVQADKFTQQNIPVAYLLEGTFTSLYKNRFLPEGADSTAMLESSVNTRLVVMADGDLARNEINTRTRQPQALGFDPFTNNTFANRDLLLNTLAFLTDDGGLIQTRNKEIKIRPLDREKVRREKVTWQALNLVLPLALLVVYGVARVYWRRRKYARF